MKIEKIKKKFTDIGVKMAGKGFKITQVPKSRRIFTLNSKVGVGGCFSCCESKKELEETLTEEYNREFYARQEDFTEGLDDNDNFILEEYDLKVTLVKRKKK